MKQQIIALLIVASAFIVVMAIAITRFAEIMKEHPEPLWLIAGIGIAFIVQGAVLGIYLLLKKFFP